VKTFERVDGATIEGEGPANRTVRASVEMEVPSTNSTFTYRAQAQTDENGEFSLTVPYSTTGYDEYSAEDGYTEPSVRATGPYELRTGATFDGNSSLVAYNASVDVTEGQVVGEDTGPIEVTLDEQVLGSVGGSENGTDGSAGGTSSGSDDTTTGTGDDSTSGSGDATATPTDGNGSTGEALAPPQLPGTAALIPLVGAGLLSAVGFTRRN
jgi:dolichyl-diphosphooligosaccharide--protein glycosyltransferase